ncbi:MAG: LamG-like jellyroll fold domain-containing protein, partial [Bacillota bacterium]
MRRKHIYLFCLTLLILGCLTVKVQFVGVVGAEEPVAHYKFEGNLEDETGNYGQAQIIGEEIGPSVGEVTDKTGKEYGSINFTDGWQGQAANFDGSSGLLLPEDLISDDTYTVTLWAKPEEINPLSPLFFGGYGDQENISLVPNGPIGDTMVWSKAAWYYANTEMTIPKKQWTHLAFSVDKGEISVYINGKEMYNDTDFPELFAGLSEVVFALGVDWWNSPYKGQIDELRIYDSVVAAKRVAEMAEGAPEIGQEEEPEFGEVGVHDPMVTEDNGTFYVFGSHLASAKSEDLLDWEQISSRVANNN